VAGPKDPSGNGRQLANGAMAGYVNGPAGKPVWRILSGASKDYMRSIARSGPRTYPAISPKAAKRAFNRHYNKSPRYKSPRGRKQARSYDLGHKAPRVVTDSRYRRSPHRFDYPGVDVGAKPNTKLSGAKLAAAQQRAASARAARSQAGGADCGFNYVTSRCSKAGTENPEWCEVGPKGKCRKSPAGRKNSPKNAKNVAKGKALAASRKSKSPGRPKRALTQGWDVEDTRRGTPSPVMSRGRPSRVQRVTGHKSPAFGSKGSACAHLSPSDCARHPACSFAKGTGKGSGCRRTRSSGGAMW
jgi:hypothetical protein